MRKSFSKGPLGFMAAGRDKYHHGNLKETLLDAAEALIAERGPMGVTLSELARMAGVSPAAIYRHYADLNALVGAVARRGFGVFTARLRAAGSVSGPGIPGFSSMGAAYLGFARENPGAYAAMFSSTITDADPEVCAASETAFRTLAEGLAGALTEAGIDQGSAFSLAIKIWSLAHGIATLTGSGRLSPAIGVTPEKMLQEGVRALIIAEKIPQPAAPPAAEPVSFIPKA